VKASLQIALFGCLVTLSIAVTAAAAGPLRVELAAGSAAWQTGVDPSLEKDALRAVRIAIQWLEQQQAEDGHWSNAQFPAVTALVVWAHLRNPDAISVDEKGRRRVEVYPYVQKGIDYILSCVQEDGGIYRPLVGRKGGGLKNYNTAVCMAALAATGDGRYGDVIRRARRFLFGIQYLGGGEFDGGMGYDAATDRAYADMSNTYVAIEAIRYTEWEFLRYADEQGAGRGQDRQLMERLGKLREESEEAGQKRETLNWQRAIQFLARCQNLPQTNKERWVSPDQDDRGGFVYYPANSKAGQRITADGGSYPRSYGSMTYAGLLSFIYADVDREDQRVLAAYDWIRRHYTVDENPGLGAAGLYYYYHTMAKALTAYGEDVLKLPDGRSVNWRSALLNRLISLQKIEPMTGYGYWLNENGRWWENDPVLVTAYAILTLETCLQWTAP